MVHDVSLAHPIRMKFAAQVGWVLRTQLRRHQEAGSM